ncbi:hypothetical protein DHW03_01705 [Pedobacter yonginense]|uniref:Uncharacterized protein n=1 Tax=Pedobacter yonginense TaxID=651869 RepID=A0A317EQ51_9SPHI|nr:hypothetical protein [Pedobacter yonginense]PWS28592.1 hypothetical protein DHW03_01705 [Pedobacter yonginense]
MGTAHIALSHGVPQALGDLCNGANGFPSPHILQIPYNKHNQSINGEVKAIDFEQDGHYIIYIPSLGLSAYGNDVNEARQMISKAILPDFCQTLLEQPLSKLYMI